MAKQPPSPIVIALVLLLILGLGLATWWFGFRAAPVEEPQPEPPPSSVETTEEPSPPPPDLPGLDESDPLVRELVEQLTAHPTLAKWLIPEDLVRRFVAAVDNVARGESPRTHLSFLDPGQGFKSKWVDGDLIIAPESYNRYDTFAEVLTAVDEERAVDLYRQLEPLFSAAYRELGYPEGDFDQILRQAIQRLTKVKIPNGPIQLEERVSNYRFADPGLEEMGAVEKHLLRMGSLNARTVQMRLRAFLDAWTQRTDSDPQEVSPES